MLELASTLSTKEELFKDLETQLEMAKSGSGDVSQVKLDPFEPRPLGWAIYFSQHSALNSLRIKKS